jgi:transcriptional regulator GlxA family with amidase domain
MDRVSCTEASPASEPKYRFGAEATSYPLRVERAQSLLHGSDLDIEAIAAEVGYVDGATLRTLLRQRLGRGVRDLRAQLR